MATGEARATGAGDVLACHYWNKAPRPSYVRACERGAWSIAYWPKSNPGQVTYRCFKCRSWRHLGECSRWKGAQDFRRIEGALKAYPGDWTYIVLTFDRISYRDNFHAFKALYGCFDKLRKRLKRRFGDFKFISLCEQHRDGWPHLNILIRNSELAAACADSGWKSLRKNWLEPNAIACGFGFRTWIEPVRDDEAMAGYMVKLAGSVSGEVAKLNQAPVAAPRHFRRLRASRGLLPKPYKNPEITGCLKQVPLDVIRQVLQREKHVQVMICATAPGWSEPNWTVQHSVQQKLEDFSESVA